VTRPDAREHAGHLSPAMSAPHFVCPCCFFAAAGKQLHFSINR
jgi:hypothetical protein